MKKRTIKELKRVSAILVSILLMLSMMPLAELGGWQASAYTPQEAGQNAYANGSGWTATGAEGLAYFKKIYGSSGGTQKEITELEYGTTLSNGTYYIMNDITLVPTAADRKYRQSALRIAAESTVRLIFLNGSKLRVKGGDALTYGAKYTDPSTQTQKTNTNIGGAGAGILLPASSTLIVDGNGIISATGGSAADGEKGEQGKVNNVNYKNKNEAYGGHGGRGGYGGGGAGAGIGTAGGQGGAYGSGGNGYTSHYSDSAYTGNPGSAGSDSQGSGTIKQYGNVKLNCHGGQGGYGGQAGSGNYSGAGSKSNGAGGGGGGGGAGAPANAIGSGGPGGGGAGGGGGGHATTGGFGAGAGGSGGSAGAGYNGRRAASGGIPGGAWGYKTYRTDGKYGNGQSDGWSWGGYGEFNGNEFRWTGIERTGRNGSGGTFEAVGGYGGAGGASGKYGKSGIIYGTTLGSKAQSTYRLVLSLNRYSGGQWSKVDYHAGEWLNTFWMYPVRELVMELSESETAKLNEDGSGSYLYEEGGAVRPTISVVHAPTGRPLVGGQGYKAKYEIDGSAPGADKVGAYAIAEYVQPESLDNSDVGYLCSNDWKSKDPDDSGKLAFLKARYYIDYMSYMVTFDVQGGIGSDKMRVKYGYQYPVESTAGGRRSAPIKAGNIFDGYYTEPDGKGKQYFEAEDFGGTGEIKAKATEAVWDIPADTTLYANWIPLSYKIRFWSDFGNGTEYVPYNLSDAEYENPDDPTSAKIKVSQHGELLLPSAKALGISRDHYDFVGWNIYEEQDWAMYKADKRYKAGLASTPGETVDIYAAWRPKDQIMISYDANGGSGAPPLDGTWPDADYTIAAETPERDGYSFMGWNTAAQPVYDGAGKQTNGFSYDPLEVVKQKEEGEDNEKAFTKNTTLYAQWKKNPTVTYRANGGTFEGETPVRSVESGKTVNVEFDIAVTRSGYEFKGWRLKGTDTIYTENGTKEFKMGEENVILEAEWEPQKEDIVFVTNTLWDNDGWRYAYMDKNPSWESGAPGWEKEQKGEYDQPFEFRVFVDNKKVNAATLKIKVNDVTMDPDKTDVTTYPGMTVFTYTIPRVRGAQMVTTSGLEGMEYPVILNAGDGRLVGNVTSHKFGKATTLPVADETKPVNPGYGFEGWSATENGTDYVNSIAANEVPASNENAFRFYAVWSSGKYNLEFDITPMPGQEGSVIHWDGNTGETGYARDVTNNDAFKNIKYDKEVTLPDLEAYLYYEYLASHEGGGAIARASFLGWSREKDAIVPDYVKGAKVKSLTEESNSTVTLYPVWGAPVYKTVLDPNGGELTESVTGYQAGQTITLPTPERDGFVFVGWYKNRYGDDDDVTGITKVEAIDPDTVGDQVYYAKWSKGQYKYKLVNVNPTTGETIGSQTYESNDIQVGSSVTLPADSDIGSGDLEGWTKPSGMTLAGWSTEGYEGSKPGNLEYAAGSSTDALWTADGDIVEGLTLYPVWIEEGAWTLSYDANGGTGTPATATIRPEDADTEVDFEVKPTRIGFNFLGWSEDKNYNPSSSTLYTEDAANITMTGPVILYAAWESIPYDITFDANTQEEGTGFNVSDEWKQQVKQTVPSYEDEIQLDPGYDISRGSAYQMLGWALTKDGQVKYQTGSKVKGFADIDEESGELKGKTLYAVWFVKSGEQSYLMFDAQGGTGAPSMQTHPAGADISLADVKAPVRHGYEFKGWAEAADASVDDTVDHISMPAAGETRTVYAVWEKLEGISIVYEAGEGSGSVPYDAKTYYLDESARIQFNPAPTIKGQSFDGWEYKNKSGQTITLKKDDASAANITVDRDLMDAAVEEGDIKLLKLTATFTKNKYTIHFDGNGATGSAPSDIVKTYGEAVALPEPTDLEKAGTDFVSWNTDPNGDGTSYNPGSLSADLSASDGDTVTLYAIWQVGAVDVEFDNWGKPFTRSFTLGEDLPDDLPVPARVGHDFDGYYLDDVRYFGSNMQPDKKWDKTKQDLPAGSDKLLMKSRWTPQTYTISYHDSTGVLAATDEITYGKKYRLADDADLTVPSGYKHVGWTLDPEGDEVDAGMEAKAYINPNEDNGLYAANAEGEPHTIAVYAVYREVRKLTVSYDANGGTDAPQDSKKYNDGDMADIIFNPIPIRENYDFLGWTTYSNTASVLPGGANQGRYYGDATCKGVETIDGFTYHYGEDGGSNEEKDIQHKVRNDVKLYAVWVPKTYYLVEFNGNHTSNGGMGTVTAKETDFSVAGNIKHTASGEEEVSLGYTANASKDMYSSNENIYRTSSSYKDGRIISVMMPDGDKMFTNSETGRKFMGWAKNSDAKVPDYEAGELLSDITNGEKARFYAVWAKPVTEVTLIDIEEPVKDGVPSEDVEATKESGVNVTRNTWSPSTEKFSAGTAYKLTVKMKAADGYYFDKDKRPDVTFRYTDVSGGSQMKPASEVTINEEGDVLTAHYTFEATSSIVVNSDDDSNKDKPVSITNVTAPTNGQKLVAAGNAVDMRVDNNGSWTPVINWSGVDVEGNPIMVGTYAEPDTIYTASLTISPATGYLFKESVTRVTFDGEELYYQGSENATEDKHFVIDDSGKMKVTYTFPKTAGLDNSITLNLRGIAKDGTLNVGESLPTDLRTSDEIILSADRANPALTWNTKDKKAKSATDYQAVVTFRPNVNREFQEGNAVDFDGEQIIISKDPAVKNEANYAFLNDDGTLTVARTYRSQDSSYISAFDPDEVSVAWDAPADANKMGLPTTVDILTTDGKKTAEVTWDLTGYTPSDESHRDGNTVTLTGKIKLPVGVEPPKDPQTGDPIDATTTIKLNIGKDPAKQQEDDQKKAEEEAKKKAEEEANKKVVDESNGIQPGASMADVDRFLMNRASDDDPIGSGYAPLMLMSKKQSKKNITLTWKTIGAPKYVIYGNQCGKNKKLKKLKTATNAKFKVTNIEGLKLKKGKYHKFIIVAYDANDKVVATSKIVHVATKGNKKAQNHKKVTVASKVVKKAKKLKAGKTLKLKAKAVGKSVKKHRKLCYETSNPNVATVSKSGKIKAVSNGSCYIYVYAQNGVYKRVKVTVK